MICDEVQTGMGRTGKWFAFQHNNVQLDIISIAKGIASGLTMGTIIAREGFEFTRGEHDSTFAGGTIVCDAGNATFEVSQSVLPGISTKGELFHKCLEKFNPRVRGLMIGFTSGAKAVEIKQYSLENSVFVNAVGDGNIRIVPLLVITPEKSKQPVRSSMNQLMRSKYHGAGYVHAASAVEPAKKYGFKKIARLGSNENPFSPSDAVLKAAVDALSGINRYPGAKVSGFASAVRKYIHDAPVVTFGFYMDGIIKTTIPALMFSVYGIASMAASARVVSVPRRADFSVDGEAFSAEAKDAKFSFLCLPNNPTGNVTPLADVEKILKNISSVLFLDCAYAEFAGVEYYDPLKYDNLIIGHTLSKVYGFAGLRTSYAFVLGWFVGLYSAVVTPFTLTEVSSAAACAEVADTKYRADFIAHVKKWRGIFVREIPYPTIPFGTNIILIDVSLKKSDEAVESLARSCATFPGLWETYVRVSVEAEWENERCLAAVKKL